MPRVLKQTKGAIYKRQQRARNSRKEEEGSQSEREGHRRARGSTRRVNNRRLHGRQRRANVAAETSEQEIESAESADEGDSQDVQVSATLPEEEYFEVLAFPLNEEPSTHPLHVTEMSRLDEDEVDEAIEHAQIFAKKSQGFRIAVYEHLKNDHSLSYRRIGQHYVERRGFWSHNVVDAQLPPKDDSEGPMNWCQDYERFSREFQYKFLDALRLNHLRIYEWLGRRLMEDKAEWDSGEDHDEAGLKED